MAILFTFFQYFQISTLPVLYVTYVSSRFLLISKKFRLYLNSNKAVRALLALLLRLITTGLFIISSIQLLYIVPHNSSDPNKLNVRGENNVKFFRYLNEYFRSKMADNERISVNKARNFVQIWKLDKAISINFYPYIFLGNLDEIEYC